MVADQWALGSCLYFPNTGTTIPCRHAWLHMWLLGLNFKSSQCEGGGGGGFAIPMCLRHWAVGMTVPLSTVYTHSRRHMLFAHSLRVPVAPHRDHGRKIIFYHMMIKRNDHQCRETFFWETFLTLFPGCKYALNALLLYSRLLKILVFFLYVHRECLNAE